MSRATPKWLRRRPLLLAGWLRFSNRVRGSARALQPSDIQQVPHAWWVGRRLWFGAVLAAVVLAWLVQRPAAAAALSFLADRWALAFIGTALHAASSVSRRKARLQAEHENSWLAALPHRVSVPTRIAFGFSVQGVVLGLLCAVIAAFASAHDVRAEHGQSSTPWLDARAVWLAAVGGYVAGSIGGWFAHVFSPENAASTQYAIVRKVRTTWAVAPRLSPLSYWPAAAARALSNPQVSMRTMLFALLALPMGTTGAEAIAIGAAWMVGLYVVLNLVATVRTALAAGWWLRPTPIQPWRFMGALVSRVLLIEVGIFAAAMLVTAALGRPQAFYLAVGATIAWLPLYVTIVLGVCVLGLRPANYGKHRS